jgi:MFS family permease
MLPDASSFAEVTTAQEEEATLPSPQHPLPPVSSGRRSSETTTHVVVVAATALRSYALAVDRGQNDRATEIRLWTGQRPHMRAFHCATLSFFAAFFMWFSISPLLGVIAQDLSLSRQDLWISTICSELSTILTRFVVGPACDMYGARLPMALVLVAAALPTALTGTVQSLAGLCAIRALVGVAGSSFVMAQYWMGQMFVKEVIGSANAIVAGWGGAISAGASRSSSWVPGCIQWSSPGRRLAVTMSYMRGGPFLWYPPYWCWSWHCGD